MEDPGIVYSQNRISLFVGDRRRTRRLRVLCAACRQQRRGGADAGANGTRALRRRRCGQGQGRRRPVASVARRQQSPSSGYAAGKSPLEEKCLRRQYDTVYANEPAILNL